MVTEVNFGTFKVGEQGVSQEGKKSVLHELRIKCNWGTGDTVSPPVGSVRDHGIKQTGAKPLETYGKFTIFTLKLV